MSYLNPILLLQNIYSGSCNFTFLYILIYVSYDMVPHEFSKLNIYSAFNKYFWVADWIKKKGWTFFHSFIPLEKSRRQILFQKYQCIAIFCSICRTFRMVSWFKPVDSIIKHVFSEPNLVGQLHIIVEETY